MINKLIKIFHLISISGIFGIILKYLNTLKLILKNCNIIISANDI